MPLTNITWDQLITSNTFINEKQLINDLKAAHFDPTQCPWAHIYLLQRNNNDSHLFFVAHDGQLTKGLHHLIHGSAKPYLIFLLPGEENAYNIMSNKNYWRDMAGGNNGFPPVFIDECKRKNIYYYCLDPNARINPELAATRHTALKKQAKLVTFSDVEETNKAQSAKSMLQFMISPLSQWFSSLRENTRLPFYSFMHKVKMGLALPFYLIATVFTCIIGGVGLLATTISTFFSKTDSTQKSKSIKADLSSAAASYQSLGMKSTDLAASKVNSTMPTQSTNTKQAANEPKQATEVEDKAEKKDSSSFNFVL